MGLTVTSMGCDEKKDKHELKKHAATIHCANTLSLLQRKISNALLFHAYKELLFKDEHEISIKQLCTLISYQGNNHAVIKEALKGLLSTVIEWNVVSDTTGAEDWTASSIIASVSLKGPLCYYAYSPRMKQLLHSPTMFGKINLYIQSRFKSSYGLALYENCVRYRGLPFTKWFEMETFRKLMGVPENHYIIFRDFKRRVLDKSVEEVNTYSDLLVEPELSRERRQVIKIRFSLKERAKKARLGTKLIANIDPNDQGANLRLQLINQFGLTPAQTEQALRDYSEDFILGKLQMVSASKNYQLGKVKNNAAYLLSALKHDYQLAKCNHELIKEQKREENRSFYKLKELKRLAEEVDMAYVRYREESIDQFILALKPSQKKTFIRDFKRHAAISIKTILKLQRNKYTQATILNSPQIKGLLRQYALQILPNLTDTLVSIEKFVENFSENHRNAWYQFKLVDRI